MAQKDLIIAHLHDTTLGVPVVKKAAKIRTTILWIVGSLVFGLLVSFAQMHQREKADANAVNEGKIPSITISSK